jgi:thiamine kinase-like enzyme
MNLCVREIGSEFLRRVKNKLVTKKGLIAKGLFILLFSVLWFKVPLSWSQEQHLPSENLVVSRALNKTFGTSLPQKFQPLTGGFSSPGIYKFWVDKKPYVLRLSHPNRNVADEERTLTCMSISDKRRLAPKIRYASIQDRIVIMDFIKSESLVEERFPSKLLVDLALTVRKLHKGPSFPKFLSVFSVRKKFEKSLESYKSNLIELVSSELAKIETILEKQKISCPTHNDLKPENILFDGKKFWFVDWEASCQGDPYFDLATVIVFYNLNAEQENLFLKTYFGEYPTSRQRTKLYMMKQEVLGYYGMAYLMVSKIKKTPPLSPEEIEKLPTLKEYLKNKFLREAPKLSYEELQKFGWVLLKEVFINTKSAEFKYFLLRSIP